jgi:hypothetical protein
MPPITTITTLAMRTTRKGTRSGSRPTRTEMTAQAKAAIRPQDHWPRTLGRSSEPGRPR